MPVTEQIVAGCCFRRREWAAKELKDLPPDVNTILWKSPGVISHFNGPSSPCGIDRTAGWPPRLHPLLEIWTHGVRPLCSLCSVCDWFGVTARSIIMDVSPRPEYSLQQRFAGVAAGNSVMVRVSDSAGCRNNSMPSCGLRRRDPPESPRQFSRNVAM